MSEQNKGPESKVLILGLSQSGKTSIRQVIFEGFAPESTMLNAATVRINRKLFNMAGAGINLFDVGGQINYLNEVFQQYKERTFSDVKALVFVVDVSDAANIMRSKYYFDLALKNLSELSKTARIYVFAHKIDIVPLNKRKNIVQSIGDIFEVGKQQKVSIFGTSIFDQSIWDAMQIVLSYVYPKDDFKSSEIKKIVREHNLTFLALSTAQGLVLYSDPEVESGVNYLRLRNELTKAYFPNMYLSQAIFTFDKNIVYMKEIQEDIVITSVFPPDQKIAKAQEAFEDLTYKINNFLQPDELLGQVKIKMKQTLTDYLKNKGLKNLQDLERKINTKIGVKCDICGKQVQKSILDIAIEHSEQIERGIKITTGFGATSVEIDPIHECIEGIREIPILLDGNLDYRRYERSKPI